MEKSTAGILKIAIVGPESTGKSTLTQELARFYNEPWVPEIARDYISNLNRPYTLNDITQLAGLQLQAEQEKIKSAKKYLFCDTTLLVNKIWASFVFQQIPDKIIELYQPQNYALHLLCDIDLPWEDDPLREHPLHRKELLEYYLNELKESHAHYFLIHGLEAQRTKNAIEIISNFQR